jgi:hypothetical protein
MTTGLRWRVLTLQVVMIAVFAFAAGFLFWAGNFTHSYVHDQLASQQITFAPKAALSPAEYSPTAIKNLSQYAGRQLTTGDQAKVYANDFIGTHLKGIGKGHTYAYWSGKALADKNPKTQAVENDIALTLFRGESLRAMLLNAWGWWTVGTYAFYAAIGMTIATIAVIAALIFELLFAARPVTAGYTSGKAVAAQ